MLQPEQILEERYQLQQKLGRTAAGRQTWLAQDLQANELVIIKLLAFSPQMQWEELKLFEREAQVLANLNHPCIPRYRDYFSIDPYIGAGLSWFGLVQDYISGASLQELLEQGQHFTEQQVKTIATQVLEILIYLHELSPPVLHRDIKPSNLIWGEDEQLYLVDFGAVQDKAAFTGVTFTVVGTSGYAPLEQFWGRAVPASDLYALGATLIHLLTGIHPADLPQKDSQIQFANRVSVSPSFVRWIEKLTETAIERRFSTSHQALQSLESGLVISASTTGLSIITKVVKPANTVIKLNISAELMEIDIPPGKVGYFPGCCLILFIPLTLVGLTLLFTSLYFIGLSCLLVAIFQACVAIGLNSKIKFKRKTFEITRKLFNFTYLRQTGVVAEIIGLFLVKESGLYHLEIRSGNVTGHYSHFFGGGLSDVECAWLAQEIQDWLHFK